ncbi:HupE/UreJ family protein [Parasedimentitalea psychrophila]|uniref:HupE/UreJ family protein n=1 Tax=Parasedimentitalea psychrophila TaxID=2997337 RepID=A0A9Y2P192_9RHOB|nr:HupE/UreJ family protein [Parasedimentitalea psychrophila]WIY23897.1 HupE/UreJ family protein [Parasedimentitalea psychrophila]
MKVAGFGIWPGKYSTAIFATCLSALLLLSGPAIAHFLLNLNTRIIHVEHLSNGLRVYLRLPMPYLVANLVGPEQADGLPDPAPYTTNTREDGNVVYYLDVEALRADSGGLGKLVANGHQFVSNGVVLQATVETVRVYPGSRQPPFSTLGEARASFQDTLYPQDFPVTYVGDTVVDVVFLFAEQGEATSYLLSSSLNPGLPGQEKTANLILDYYPGSVEVFRARGLLQDPISISRSPWAAAATFVKEGMLHILDGLDHVLFVICLALGAASFKSLFARTTGFTIGHSVTLSLGFFGFVPSGAWFIPTIELGIALSIIFAALVAMKQKQGNQPPERTMFAVTVGIGILHGLGFSFVLHKILQVDSPNIWQSLLSFNVGVELGQFLIILACWPLFRLLSRLGDSRWLVARWGIAAPCIAVAGFWTIQRALLVVQSG